MKTTSAALFIALLGAALAAKPCPDELPGKVELVNGFEFHYGILEEEQALCGKIFTDTEAWVGFGVNSDARMMVGTNAVIALPEDNVVQQYALTSKSNAGVSLSARQSLIESSVTQENGTTVATFKQLLSDNGVELTPDSFYLLARGSGNTLAFHRNRDFVSLDFESNKISLGDAVPEAEEAMSDESMMKEDSMSDESMMKEDSMKEDSMSGETMSETSTSDESSMSEGSMSDEASMTEDSMSTNSAPTQKIGGLMLGTGLLMVPFLTV